MQKEKFFRWIYYALTITLSFIIFLTAVLLGLYYWRTFSDSNQKIVKNMESRLSELLERIEYVCITAPRFEWVSDLSLQTADEIGDCSVIDEINYISDMRIFNAMVGMGCETTIWFKRSDCVVTSNGIDTRENYFNNFYDSNGTVISEARTNELIENGILGDVWFDFSESVDESIVFLSENEYSTRSFYFVFVLSESFLTREVCSDLDKNKKAAILFGDTFLLGENESGYFTESPIVAKGLHIRLYSDFPIFSYIMNLLLLCGIFTAVYLLARHAVTRKLSDFRFRTERLVQMLNSSENVPEGEVLELLESTVHALIDREEELQGIVKENCSNIEKAYFKILLNDDGEISAETEKALRFLKIDTNEQARIVCFASQPPDNIFDGRKYVACSPSVFVFCGEEYVHTGLICGYSQSGTIRKGLAQLYSQALIAKEYASLYEISDCSFEEAHSAPSLELDKKQYVKELRRAIVERETQTCTDLLSFRAKFGAARYKASDVVAFLHYIIEELSDIFVDEIQSGKSLGEYEQTMREMAERSIQGAKDLIDNRYENYFRAIREYIDENFTDPRLSLKLIGEHFHYSVSYISRIFSENGEFRYSEYVNAKRVRYAQQLMKENYKLNDVARMCGFENVVTFRRIFKKETGSTPSDYKINVSSCSHKE